MIFQTGKNERLTELGYIIDNAMAEPCSAAVALEISSGSTYRNAMVSVSCRNPFTVENIQAQFPDATDIAQIDLDSLWMINVVDLCFSAIF